MTLELTVLRDPAAVAALTGEWQALHERSGETNPFNGPDWSATWLAQFAGAPNEPYVIVLREGTSLIGVAPLFRRPVARGRATMICPAGIGLPWVMPFEAPSILAAPEHGRKVARAVVAHLCGADADDPAVAPEWDVVRLVLGDAASWLEPEWLPGQGFTSLVRRMRAAVVLDLSGAQNAEDVYVGRRNLKESFRRARNRLTREFGADGWSVRRVTAGDDADEAFGRLLDLHSQRAWMRSGRPVHGDVFDDARVRDYLRDVLVRASGAGRASFYELLMGDDVVAVQTVLHTATASYISVSGSAEKAWPFSAVTLLQSRAVEDARRAGHSRVCMSTGPNQAKLRWTSDVEIVPEHWIVGPRARSRAFYLGVELQQVVSSFRSERSAHRV